MLLHIFSRRTQAASSLHNVAYVTLPVRHGSFSIDYNAGMSPVDLLRRPMRDLRISVTDRCNFRCTYCMPFDEYPWIPNAQILTFDEIGRLARAFVELGVDKIRLTGGEPLLRAGLEDLIQRLAAIDGLADLCLTTNA